MRRKEGGQLLSRKAEQVRRRGSEEDLDWVRRRMQEVNLSRPEETSRPRVDPETHGFVPQQTRERSRQHPEPSRRFEGGRKVSTGSPTITPLAPPCARCQHPVFMAELVRADNKAWHKCCFTCLECGKSLNPGSCCPREGEVHCQPCYQKHYGPHGVGFGLGSCLQAPP